MREQSEFRNKLANCDAAKASRHRSVVEPGRMSRWRFAILVWRHRFAARVLPRAEAGSKKQKGRPRHRRERGFLDAG